MLSEVLLEANRVQVGLVTPWKYAVEHLTALLVGVGA